MENSDLSLSLNVNTASVKAFAGVAGLIKIFQFMLAVALIKGFKTPEKPYLSTNYYFFLIVLYLADTPNILFDSIATIFDLSTLQHAGAYYLFYFTFLKVFLVLIMAIEKVTVLMKENIVRFKPNLCIVLTIFAGMVAALFAVLDLFVLTQFNLYSVSGLIYMIATVVLLFGVYKYYRCTKDGKFVEIKVEMRIFWSLFISVIIQVAGAIYNIFVIITIAKGMEKDSEGTGSGTNYWDTIVTQVTMIFAVEALSNISLMVVLLFVSKGTRKNYLKIWHCAAFK